MDGTSRIRVIVTPRDIAFLKELVDSKILDREQYQIVAGIRRTNRANERLHLLHSAGLIRRHFLGTIAGGRKAIYSLSPKGAKLIGHEKSWRFQHPEDELLIGDSFTAHQSAVNWVWISAKYRRPLGVEFARWLNFHEPLTAALPLVPDGYFVITAGGISLAHFVEVDLGTETSKTWERKTEFYLKLATSGEFARLFHADRFRVLVTAPSERRLVNLRATVQKQTTKIFYFIENKIIKSDGIYVSQWLRPEGTENQSLV
jgi:hypothetical protein